MSQAWPVKLHCFLESDLPARGQQRRTCYRSRVHSSSHASVYTTHTEARHACSGTGMCPQKPTLLTLFEHPSLSSNRQDVSDTELTRHTQLAVNVQKCLGQVLQKGT
eukprot:1158530-Pelagomonas_calceolata.AAC.4